MNNGFPLGVTIINWTATDSANNTSHTIQNVTIQDTTPPTITINGDAVLDVPFDSSYFDAGATATDIYDGDLTDDIIVNNPVDTATVGEYQVTYDVTDSNGNAAEQKTRTVTVLPKPDSPPAISPIIDVTINEGATQTVTVDATDPDGDPITYSLIQNPPFVSISGNLITISPEYHHARDYDVTVRAEAGGDFVEVSFALKVSDAFPAGDSISAAVDNASSTLEVTQGEPLLVKFQYSESLPGTGWQCFALTDEDGNRVKSNGDIKLWNDRSQYSYDGINWGGDRYNDKVFYKACKYLEGDSIWIKVDTRIDADDGNTEDEKYYLTISEPSSVMPQFQDVPVELTIKELPPSQIEWNDTKAGVATSGYDVIKPSAVSTKWGNSGTFSAFSITGNGYVSAVADETSKARMIGLSAQNKDNRYDTIDYAAYLDTKNRLSVYENGKRVHSGSTYDSGDTIKVQRTDDVITYIKNDVVFYTSEVSSDGATPLHADTALLHSGATLRSISMVQQSD